MGQYVCIAVLLQLYANQYAHSDNGKTNELWRRYIDLLFQFNQFEFFTSSPTFLACFDDVIQEYIYQKYTNMQEKKLNVFRFGLRSSVESIQHRAASDLLSYLQQCSDEELNGPNGLLDDEELLNLLSKSRFLSLFIPTTLFPSLMRHLMSSVHSSTALTDSICVLVSNRMYSDAASLLFKLLHIPTSLQSIDYSAALLRRYLSKISHTSHVQQALAALNQDNL
jgi:hypothetical protein